MTMEVGMKKLVKALGALALCSTMAASIYALDYKPAVDPKPVDPKATENTVRLKKYLSDIYGTKMISGQMDLTWKDSVDMAKKVYNDTGKYPALMGYDFMNYTTGGQGMQQVEEAIAWWKKGGIVAFMWHWKGPGRIKEFYTEKNNFSIPYDAITEELQTDTNQFRSILKDLDKIAGQLARLQDAGVPVLWRPLHEASGNDGDAWFWWGASGSGAYIALYRYMYDYFTNVKGLHNLIWVWNGQNEDWYPGDDVVDIMGTDIYQENHRAQKKEFDKTFEMSDSPYEKEIMVALTECGAIPDPDEMQRDDVYWLYFMVWNDTEAKGRDKSNFWEGGYWNDDDFKKKVYGSEFVITLDELPDLKKYPLK